MPNSIRVVIIMDETGVSANGHAGITAGEALAAWVYANRDALGLEIEVNGRLAPPQTIDGGTICAL